MEAAVWNVRLPRVILSILVGACLSAGASYQGVKIQWLLQMF